MDVERLQVLPILAEFEASELVRLARLMEVRVWDDGDAIVEQGGTDGGAYLLLSGEMRVERKLPDGRAVDISKVEPGTFFGILSCIDGKSRGASCFAVGATECAVLSRQTATLLLNDHDSMSLRFQLTILRLLFRDMRVTNQKLAELATLPDAAVELEPIA